MSDMKISNNNNNNMNASNYPPKNLNNIFDKILIDKNINILKIKKIYLIIILTTINNIYISQIQKLKKF